MMTKKNIAKFSTIAACIGGTGSLLVLQDEICIENRKSLESRFRVSSPHGRVLEPAKHRKQGM
jgi:hypothetical protein